MSLLQSIFGARTQTEGDRDAPAAARDLFETSVTIPSPRERHAVDSDARRSRQRHAAEPETNDTPAPEESHVRDDAEASAAEEPAPITDDHPDDPETLNDRNARTVFVGNLPVTTNRKSLAKLFASCGKVESTRIRSVATTGVQLPPSQAGNQSLVRKVCTNTRRIDATVKNSVNAYVVFTDAASAQAAMAQYNNTMLDGHCIRVDAASPTIDPHRSVFVGNLPYHAQEETLRHHVADCLQADAASAIHGVRIVRDKETFLCQGFGYVLLANRTLVAEAIQKVHGTEYMGRALRVLVCGKRFKNKQGQYGKDGAKHSLAKLTPKERVQETTGALKRILTKQLLQPSTGGSKESKRKRGDKKTSKPHKAGVSKRQASVAKQGKREKSIQKRLTKGMGKNKKGSKA